MDTNEKDERTLAIITHEVGLLEPAGLPVAGIEATHKVLDARLPSNQLMTRWTTSAGKPIWPSTAGPSRRSTRWD